MSHLTCHGDRYGVPVFARGTSSTLSNSLRMLYLYNFIGFGGKLT